MKKRSKMMLVTATIAALVLVIWCALPSHLIEPSYEGCSLSGWLERGTVSVHPEKQAKLDEAYRSMGSNALPFLLNWMQYEQPRWKGKFIAFANEYLTWIQDDYSDGALLRAQHAHFVIPKLGPSACNAIPELTTLVVRTNDSQQVRSRAYMCLLILADAPTNSETKLAASNAISRIRAQDAIPAPNVLW